jgi:hypothetical protein
MAASSNLVSDLSSSKTGKSRSSSLVSALTSLWRTLTCFTKSSRSDRDDGDSTWSGSTFHTGEDQASLDKFRYPGRNKLRKVHGGPMVAPPGVRGHDPELPRVDSDNFTDSMIKELAIRPGTRASSRHSESSPYKIGRIWPFPHRRSDKSRSRKRLQRKETVERNPNLQSRNF